MENETAAKGVITEDIMKVEYDFTPESLIRLNLFHLAHSPSGRRSRLAFPGSPSLGAPVLLSLSIAATDTSDG